nr:sorting nexin-24 [Meriones unguiculatus]
MGKDHVQYFPNELSISESLKWPNRLVFLSQFCFLLSQAVILENEELPKLFLDFLNVRHLPSLPKAESCGSFDETESEESSKLSHQPVLLFLGDPYVLPAASDFPNVVIEGVLRGVFYSHRQPR